MKFLADENFPQKSVLLLREAGYDIKAICTDFPGISDSEVIRISNIEESIILTFDRDFGELIFKKGLKPISGLIYFRMDNFKPEDPNKYLLDLISNHFDFKFSLVVISENSLRQKKF